MIPVKVSGRYFDGKSAAAHDVTAEPSGSHLHIKFSDGSVAKSWSYNEIIVLEEAAPPLPTKITSRRDPDARLLIPSRTEWEKIKIHLNRSEFVKTLPTGFWHFVGYAALSVAVIAAVWFSAPAFLEQASVFVPASWERALGKKVMMSVINDPVCVDPAGRKVFDRMVATLQKAANSQTKYIVTVVDNPEIMNAFAAPGGYIVLFSGVLKRAGSAEEVAGVLAHEMAHIELDHATRGIIRDLGFALMIQGMLGGGHNEAAKMVSFLGQMRYSRINEMEADDKGLSFLKRAGINSKYMAKFFEHLDAEEKEKEKKDGKRGYADKILSYASTHPLTSERIQHLKAAAEKNEKNKRVLTNAQWQDLQGICIKTESYR